MSDMTTVAFVSPILPGKQEAWRRFYQKLLGSRRCEYEESRKRLGITKELAWLQSAQGAYQADLAIVYLEVEYPEQLARHLGTSDHPFDRWLRQQLLELYGLDLTHPPQCQRNELVFSWRV
jgi:hypothetical protein